MPLLKTERHFFWSHFERERNHTRRRSNLTNTTTRPAERPKTAARIPGTRNLYVAIYPSTLYNHRSPPGPAQERRRIPLVITKQHQLQQHHSPHLSADNTSLLRPAQDFNTSSRRFIPWPRSSSTSRFKTDRLRFKITEPLRTTLCQH